MYLILSAFRGTATSLASIIDDPLPLAYNIGK